MTPLLSDPRLARQASDGDQRAFEAIYKRYHQDIYRFCLSILGRPEDAQDALQNTMVKALRALPGERREIKLKPWLYRVAHNESIDLLRRRREGAELDSAHVSAGAEIAETVAQRERLGHLLADLGELPERQRSALVMRELGGLDYEQIGAAFESSPAVARQTVYEARLGLRELEAGREMSCEQVTRQLSEADGRVARRRNIRAHLRTCPECRAFRNSIDSRRRDLAALAPLPAVAAASILQGLVGGKVAGSAGAAGATAAGAGAGAGKVAGTSVALKAVATVAVAATIGGTAADRGGLIDLGLSGGDKASSAREAGGQTEPSGSGPATKAGAGANAGSQANTEGRQRAKTSGDGGVSKSQTGSGPTPAHGGTPAGAARMQDRGQGAAAGLPAASRHGQETAASHKAGGADGRGNSRRHGSPVHPISKGSSHGHNGAPGHSGGGAQAKGGAAKGQGQASTPPAAKPEKAPPPLPASPADAGSSILPKTQPSDGEAAAEGAEASP
jgi:RNA polymerase sigma factor (sigma-70 family)